MNDFLELIKFYKETRQFTEKLCQPLQLEDHFSQPVEHVSPPKWHLAHTTWFFEAVILKQFNANYKIYSEEFLFLFNSYYVTLGERSARNERGNKTRPTLKQVLDYRTHVDYELVKFLESNSGNIQKIAHLMELGINHEKQHQELLITDIKYILFQNPSFPAYIEFDESLLSANPGQPDRLLSIEEGLYNIGYEGPDFYFDNETGKHQFFLHDFKFHEHTVSNKLYLEFIESGAYQDFRHWLSDGWTWINEHQVKAPLYWIKIEDEWHYYTLGGLRKIDLNAPVTHISYYEADAYASWAGKRLLTEFEWEVAAGKYGQKTRECNFLEREIFNPVPNENNNQMLGNVWEWTNSAYLAYPFFKKADGAIAEYNGKFMANQMVLRGGSCATPYSQLRNTYRNFFYLHQRWQYTGLRLAV